MKAQAFQTCAIRLGPRTANRSLVVVLAITPHKTLRAGVGSSRFCLRHGELSAHRNCRRIACQGGETVVEEEDGLDTMSTNNGGAMESAAERVAEELPDGNLVYTEPSQFKKLFTSFKLIFALPWRRFKKGSVLSMQLEGNIQEILPGMFSSAISLPAICDCLTKAAYDPRVAGVFLKVGALECGWAKVLEIRRHLEFFRQSGKFTIGYMERGNEKEYFLLSACEEVYLPPSANLGLRGLSVSGTFLRGTLDKIGVEPQVRRIGKYKSAGDQLLREDMSEPQKEQLSALLEDLYEGFVDGVSKSRGKTKEQVMEMLEEGFIDMKSFKEGGWVTDLKYVDELIDLVKERQNIKKEKKLKKVTLRRYAAVSPSAFGLAGRQTIAVVRASGVIVGDAQGMQSNFITSKSVIREIQQARDNKAVKAIVVRVDSPGGDALASDLMWREIQKAAKDKPVIASMSDVAASGGYYMSMAASKIVAEALTITGSIGVVLGKFSLEELYKKIGVGKEILSKGKYAEIFSDNRSFSEEEDNYFTQLAEHAYKEFRNKAAECRDMEPDEMQDLAQGRVWSGRRANDVGLVDAIGGISRAIAVAKEAAKIPEGKPVRILELSRKRGSPLDAFQRAGAVSGDVASTLFIFFGLGSLILTQKPGERLDGILGAVFGLLGLLGPRLNAKQSDAEYLMEDVTMDSAPSTGYEPQAIMNELLLGERAIMSPHLRDLISKIL